MSAMILFDGACNLCNASVRFIAANDPARRFAFVSLQSPSAALALEPFGIDPATIASVVLIDRGRVFTRSDAALRIAGELRAPWTAAALLLAVPERVRDAVYDWIARNRIALFGRS